MQKIRDFEPLPLDGLQYPLPFMQHNLAILLKNNASTRIIGLADPQNIDLIQRLELFHCQEEPAPENVEFITLERQEVLSYLSRINTSVDRAKDSRLGRSDRLNLDRMANDAPIINLVNSRILEGFSKGASDIHIESLRNKVHIRYRIDGVLRSIEYLDLNLFPAISSRIKLMANLNIMERRLPQDGRFSVDFDNQSINIRISVIPTSEGESIVLRMFQNVGASFKPADLGLTQQQLKVLRKQFHSPHGLLLVTGPTGSGKTTTLHAILRELNLEDVKIITIEDPVEYAIDGVDQIQIQQDIGLTFPSILRRILRQDPDIIMVGEIRDAETAQLAVRAALTGHLVLSTIHTNDAASTIPRLINMGIPPYLLAAVLRAAVAQRLVRRICPDCKFSRPPDKYERIFLKSHEAVPELVYKGSGCENCGHSGYKGRIALVEIMQNCRQVEQLISKNAGAKHIEMAAFSSESGMAPILADGLEKIAGGLTTIHEVQRVLFSLPLVEE